MNRLCSGNFSSSRYEASEGTTRVQRRKEKRYVDLAASRGELIEVSIEAVFEPMVQVIITIIKCCIYYGYDVARPPGH